MHSVGIHELGRNARHRGPLSDRSPSTHPTDASLQMARAACQEFCQQGTWQPQDPGCP
jgi:hypothetical protein